MQKLLSNQIADSLKPLTTELWVLCVQLLKERASGMYRLSAFYFARMASDLPLDMAIPTIFVIILYFMSGLRTDNAKYFFENWFAVVLVRGMCPVPSTLPSNRVYRAPCCLRIASLSKAVIML